MLRLQCETKQYEWGQPGRKSLVAELARCGSGIRIVEDEPYAELWMGTHPSGPSRLQNDDDERSLLDWLAENPAALGSEILGAHGCKLPYLFKVLSIQTALSIQSHPDKALAEQLHSERPEVYVDANHKPELAIAVRDFQALCGFAAVEEITEALQVHPELRECVGNDAAAALLAARDAAPDVQTPALKAAFTALMTCEPAVYTGATSALQARLAAAGDVSGKEAVFLKVFAEFPQDIGTMALFFLNYLCLEPGEAIFLPANEPHAYLCGELIEAMASSDNVIRAGLTPKLRDTEVLCESLTYGQGRPRSMEPVTLSENIRVYRPPVEEFEVLQLAAHREGVVVVPPQRSPMILIVLRAQGVHSLQSLGSSVQDPALESLVALSPGLVFFVPASTQLKLHSATMPSDEGDDAASPCEFLAYAACANDSMFAERKLAADQPVSAHGSAE